MFLECRVTVINHCVFVYLFACYSKTIAVLKSMLSTTHELVLRVFCL